MSILSRLPVWEETGFMGRQAEVAWIVDKLGRQTPQNCNIIGEPRIGKTSLLYHVYQQQLFSAKGDELSVWLRLVELPDYNSGSFWQFMLTGFLASRDGVESTEIDGPAGQDSPRALFDELDEAIETFLEGSGSQRLIFFIDDFDLLVGGIASRDLDWLRSLATRYGGALAFVIGSTDSLVTLTERLTGDGVVSPFANLFHNLSVGLLRESEAVQLCEAAAVSEGASLREQDSAFLLQEAGRHPHLLKIACGYLFAVGEGDQSGTAVYAEVAGDVRLDGHVRWLCQQLLARRSEEERRVLQAVANGRVVTDTIVLNQLKRHVGLLEERAGELAFFADAFGYWVHRELAVEGPQPYVTEPSTDLTHMPSRRIVCIQDREVHLTPLENRILGYFMKRANEVCTIDELLHNVWGPGKTRAVVEKGVSRLRTKIEEDPKRPRYILSAWGEGYLLRTAV